MADIRYEIGKLFDLAFGMKFPFYMVMPVKIGEPRQPVVYPNVKYEEPNQPGVEYLDFAEAEKYSWLGTPIAFPIKLKGGMYKVYDAHGHIIEQEFDDFIMPAATVVDFRRAKNITRTNVLGNNGTVKEIYGFDDWQIRMRGICLNEPGVRTAEEQREALLRWEQIVGSIDVIGSLFSQKKIYSIAISDIDLQQIQGKPEALPFEITAMSDEPLDLVLEREEPTAQ